MSPSTTSTRLTIRSARLNIFWNYNYWFPLAIFKLFLAGTYLSQLLGWQAVVAGLSSGFIILPLTHWMSKRYGKVQFDLMSFRDTKTHLLTEALHGMRQIKYSGKSRFLRSSSQPY